MAKFAKPVASTGPGAPEVAVLPDGLVSERFPALWEYLTLTKWDDGGPRQVSTLLMFVEDGVWKGCLNDRAGQRSLWMAGDDPLTLLDRLETAVATGTAVWRKFTPRAPERGRK